MTSKAEMGAVMAFLAGSYSETEIGKEKAATYADMLADLPANLLLMAAKQHVATHNWFPKIAELRGAALSLLDQVEGIPTPAEAWEWVQSWLHRSGEGRIGGHALIEKAVSVIGGWEWLGQQPTAERHWNQKRFNEAYRDLMDGRKRKQVLLPETQRMVELGELYHPDVKKLVASVGRLPGRADE